MKTAAETARKLRIRQKLQRQEHEKLKIKQLCEESVAWFEAQSLRRYVEVVHNAPLEQLMQFASEDARATWINWATSNIDRRDPLTNGQAGTAIPLPALPEIPWTYRYPTDDFEDNHESDGR